MTAIESRYQNAIAGCEPSVIAAVESLSDPMLIQEAVARSGLGRRTFAEDVLMISRSTLWRHETGEVGLALLRRRFLQREVIRSRQMAKDGTLPKASYCGACGRGGRAPMLVTVVTGPAGME